MMIPIANRTAIMPATLTEDVLTSVKVVAALASMAIRQQMIAPRIAII